MSDRQTTPGKRKGFRLYPEDQACLEWFKKRYSIETDSQVIRLALRLWRDVIENGVVKENSPTVQNLIQSTQENHTPSGYKRWRTYKP